MLGKVGVPDVDVQKPSGDVTLEDILKRLDDFFTSQEAKDLTADDRMRTSNLDDRILKRRIRRTAIWLGILVIVGLSGILYHLTHSVFLKNSVVLPDSVIVAMFVTPIISITTITVFLLVASFRGFKEKDLEKLPISNLAREAGRHIG